jgi:hypothetical protein
MGSTPFSYSWIHYLVYNIPDATVLGVSTLCSSMLRISVRTGLCTSAATAGGMGNYKATMNMTSRSPSLCFSFANANDMMLQLSEWV